jgi:hypothetical protein
MELDELKAEWLEEKRKYRLEMSPKQRAAEIRRRAEEAERAYKRDERKKISWGLVGLALLASEFRRHAPLLANVGLGIMILCGTIAIASYFILRRRFEKSRPELPRREYLAEQKAKITIQIKLVERTIMWLLMPAFAGFALHMSAQSHSNAEVLLIVIVVMIGCAIGIWCGRRIVRKKLLPMLEDIEQELADPDVDSDSL